MIIGDNLVASVAGVGYVAVRLGVVLIGLLIISVVVWLWRRR